MTTLWAEFMTPVARLRPPEEFRPPSSVRQVLLCRVTYLRATDSCPAYREYFKSGDVVPEAECQLHRGNPLRNAGAAVGGLFKRLGRGLRGIFRR